MTGCRISWQLNAPAEVLTPATYIADDPADTPAPPCPACGTRVDIDWIEVTALGQVQPSFVPGQMRCPANQRHDVRAASAELHWPAALTDDDRVWLRHHERLSREMP